MVFSSSFNFTSKIYQPKITVETRPSVGLQMYKRIGNLLLGCEIFMPFNKTLTISDATYDDIYIYNRTNSNCKYLGFSIKYRFKTAKAGDIIDRDLNIESDKF